MNAPEVKRKLHIEPVPPQILVLLALAGGPLHGYELFDQIIGDTVGHYVHKTTLYRTLSQLESGGLVERASPAIGRTTAKTYQLTADGREALRRAERLYSELGRLVRERLG